MKDITRLILLPFALVALYWMAIHWQLVVFITFRLMEKLFAYLSTLAS